MFHIGGGGDDTTKCNWQRMPRYALGKGRLTNKIHKDLQVKITVPIPSKGVMIKVCYKGKF